MQEQLAAHHEEVVGTGPQGEALSIQRTLLEALLQAQHVCVTACGWCDAEDLPDRRTHQQHGPDVKPEDFLQELNAQEEQLLAGLPSCWVSCEGVCVRHKTCQSSGQVCPAAMLQLDLVNRPSRCAHSCTQSKGGAHHFQAGGGAAGKVQAKRDSRVPHPSRAGRLTSALERSASLSRLSKKLAHVSHISRRHLR